MDLEKPLYGSDRVKVVIFYIFLVGTLFFGIIPILIIYSSIYIMKKDKTFLPVINSEIYIKYYLISLAIGLTIITPISYYQAKFEFINYEKYGEYQDSVKKDFDNYDKNISLFSFLEKNEDVEIETAMVFGGLVLLTPIIVYILMSLFKFLYFRPLEEHKIWLIENGIFSDIKENDENLGIKGIDKMTSFSIADELIKLNDLLENKLISEEEFDKAKGKLFN